MTKAKTKPAARASAAKRPVDLPTLEALRELGPGTSPTASLFDQAAEALDSIRGDLATPVPSPLGEEALAHALRLVASYLRGAEPQPAPVVQSPTAESRGPLPVPTPVGESNEPVAKPAARRRPRPTLEGDAGESVPAVEPKPAPRRAAAKVKPTAAPEAQGVEPAPSALAPVVAKAPSGIPLPVTAESWKKREVEQAIIHTDGASKGNPGPAAAGVVFTTPQGEVVHEIAQRLGDRLTNNVAEYAALIVALRAASEAGVKDVSIRSDSQLMVYQLTGVYRIKDARMAELAEEAKTLLKTFRRTKLTAVPRENNKRADALANLALQLKNA